MREGLRPGATHTLRQVVGAEQTAAHLAVGTQIVVKGAIRNTDRKRHDAYLAATLYDRRGRAGRAAGKADDMLPGRVYGYVITGSVTAPGPRKITVKVTRVTENVAGEGTD